MKRGSAAHRLVQTSTDITLHPARQGSIGARKRERERERERTKERSREIGVCKLVRYPLPFRDQLIPDTNAFLKTHTQPAHHSADNRLFRERAVGWNHRIARHAIPSRLQCTFLCRLAIGRKNSGDKLGNTFLEACVEIRAVSSFRKI